MGSNSQESVNEVEMKMINNEESTVSFFCFVHSVGEMGEKNHIKIVKCRENK